MGIHSPLHSGAASGFPELELFDASDSKAGAGKQQPQTKPWWEARHLALPVCTFAGGPPAARHLAAASRTLQKAVAEAWDDLTQFFPSRLYVVGGLDSGFRPLATVERFDPLRGCWEALPELSSARAGPCATVAAGRLYVLGGECRGRALCDAQRFDPWLNAWEALPPMHAGRVRPAAVAHGGYLYVLGGLDGAKPLRSVERYDLLNRVWEVLPPMQCARYACSAAASGRWIIAFGGELAETGCLSSAERYDRETGKWELLPPVQAPGCGAALALSPSGRTAFSLGGLGLSGQAQGVAKRLSLDATLTGEEAAEPLRWTCVPPMPTPRHQASAAAFRGGAVAVGGKGARFEAVTDVEAFSPERWGWEALPGLPSARLRAAVAGGQL